MGVDKKISKIETYCYGAIILSLLSISFCFYYALVNCEPTFFARSGSLMTVIAIYFSSKEFRQKAKDVIVWVDERLEVEIEILEQELEQKDLSKKMKNDVIEKVKTEVKKEVSDHVNNVVKFLWKVEIPIFIIGTLIWGFGDLLPIKQWSIFLNLNQCT